MESSEKSYPIAETFTSVQGEGVYCGTLMHFVRLAGCNVGKYIGEPVQNSPIYIHHGDTIYANTKAHSVCCNAFGTQFLCDTDYHATAQLPVSTLVEQAGQRVEHICITGGEPFLHDLLPLCEAFEKQGQEIHIETSGTKPIAEDYHRVWITCSPKAGFLRENAHMVSEWKFVIAGCKDVQKIVDFINSVDADPCMQPVFVQPINGVTTVDRAQLDMVLSCIERHPWLRLSVQLHKFLGVR